MPYRTVSHLRALYRSFALLLLALLVAAGSAAAQTLAFTPGQYKIYAGNPLSPANGGPSLSPSTYTGTAANLVMNGPSGIAYDSAGNLYIMDLANYILRVVAASSNPIPALPGVSVQAGHVYTVAGTTNQPGSSTSCSGGADVQGNNCPAIQASFYNVQSIAVDRNGNVYIADQGASQVRAVYGGTGGLPGISNPQPGYIYALTNQAAATPNNSNQASGYNGPAVNALEPEPTEIAVDSHGNIYFTDGYDQTIDVIYNGGNLPANFFPSGATPTQGYLYQLTNGTGNCSSKPCDGGPVGEASLQNITGLAVDASDNLYLIDQNDFEVRAVYIGGSLPGLDSSSLTPGNIYAVAGNGQQPTPSTVMGGPALSTAIYPTGSYGGGMAAIAFDAAGDLYFTSETQRFNGFNVVQKVDTAGIITQVFGGNALCANPVTTGSGTPPLDTQLIGCAATSINDVNPAGLAIDSTGKLYVATRANSGDNSIMESDVSTSAIAYQGTIGLPISNPTITVSNLGTQPLQFNSIAFTGPFSQIATGGSHDCSGSTTLAPGASCLVGLNYLPTAAGTQTGTMTISSNSTNASNGSNTVTFSGTAAQASSNAKLTAAPSGAVLANAGQNVTLTATITPEVGDTFVPSGSVTFMDGSTSLGTATLSSGTGTLSISSLGAGAHSITVVYAGDANFTGSTSAPVNVTVSATPVAVVTVTASASSANAGQSVTFTANVAAFSGSGTPTGTVSFQDGANPLPNSTVALSAGTATFTTTSLPAGSNQVVAVYNGDSQFGANASTPVGVQVNAAGLLQLTPGTISLVTGSYFTQNGAPTSGTAATGAAFSPGSIAVDSYGNTYAVGPPVSGAGGNYSVWVTASGAGPIPGISNPQQGMIYLLGSSTACANSQNAPCGDGGPITLAFFRSPSQLAIDPLNNIYVVDSYEIRKVSAATGTVTDVGGTYGYSSWGYEGDNGPATAAKINPSSLFADANGNLYLSDSNLATVRRIDGQTGIISLIAGQEPTGLYGPVQCTTLPCGDNDLATNAMLISPTSVFVDQNNNVYIGDNDGGNFGPVVRKIDGQTGIISLYAGMYVSPGQTYASGCDEQGGTPCGDGGPALGASINNISAMTGDVAGDIYIADNNTATVRQVNAKSGIINTVAGNMALSGSTWDPYSNICSTSNPAALNPPCGDGTAATVAFLANPRAITVDSQGNLYISDSGTDTVRMVSGAATTLAFGNQNMGDIIPETVTVTNLGSQPVSITALNLPVNFPQNVTGNADCSGSMSLAPGTQCTLDLTFFPADPIAYSATATIASNSTNAVNGVNTITLTGTGEANGGGRAQNITFNAPAGPFYAGQSIPLTATTDSGLTVEYLVTAGAAQIVNNNTASASLKIIAGGTISVTAYQFGDSQYASATPVTVTLTATTPELTFTAPSPSLVQGTALPDYSSLADYTVTGLINGDDPTVVITGAPVISVLDGSGNVVVPGTTTLPIGVYTVHITQGTLKFPSYYQPQFVDGTLHITGSHPQSIVITGLPTSVTYAGPANYTFTAAAFDGTTGQPNGNPLTYTVTGPATLAGNVITITGGNANVVLTANQAGDNYYKGATASQTIIVNKAVLTVTAASLTFPQGVPIPALTAAADYVITGLLPGDTLASAVTGQPLLTVVDANGLTLPPGSTVAPNTKLNPGTYTISISGGQLASKNYNFNFVNGTLTVNNGTAQNITFPPVANVVYGAAQIALGATSDSGLAVTYTVSPSNVASVSGSTLTVHGAGTVTVTASQGGNSTYAPATPVQQTFVVFPATLTVTAANATRQNNTLNPTFTYSMSGFVYNETAGTAVSGTPALSTTATATSPAGQYPINFDLDATTGKSGSLTSTNYIFNFVPGILTVTSGGPAADYSLTATPQTVTVVQGQIAQVTITMTPVNFYQGLVNLSCGKLPANISCTFSPATLAATGNNASVSSTLTINTNSAAPVVGQARPASSSTLYMAAFYWLPGGLTGIFLLVQRRKTRWDRRISCLLVLFVLLSVVGGLSACGGSGSSISPTLAQPGNSTVTITAGDSTGAVSHNLSIAITVR